MSRMVFGALVLAAFATFGCGSRGGASARAVQCPPREEGCACDANRACNAGLLCSSGACEKLAPIKSRDNTSPTAPTVSAGRSGSSAMRMDGGAGHQSIAGASGGAGGSSSASIANGASASGQLDAGASGSTDSASGAGGSSGAGGTCAAMGGDCSSGPCCGTAPCVQNVCANDCSHNNECGSACCFKLNSGSSVCAPGNVCAPPPDASTCVGAGANCSATSCCGGELCVEKVCATACSGNAECASACCFQSLCAPASFCAMPAAGAPTGGGSQCSATVPLPPSSAIQTTIDGDFDGWQGDTVFWLANGQLWQQVSFAYTYHYAFDPAVTITPDNGSYRMTVDGVNDSITVTPLAVVVESQITSEFQGWKNAATFNLANGQVWQQSDPMAMSQVESLPDVAIFCSGGSFEMTVKGLDTNVRVTQLK